MLRFILGWLVTLLVKRRVVSCVSLRLELPRELFRVDAKAEGDVVVIGGWSTSAGWDTRAARWFSLRITKAMAPWVFEKEPYRIVATLELLAVLVAMIVLVEVPPSSGDVRIGTLGLTAGTDNRGNSYLLERCMTTKYPLCVVLMETASQMQQRGLDLRLGWLPMAANQPAGDLTNEVYTQFDARARVGVEWDDLDFMVLPGLLAQGREYLEEVRAVRDLAAQDRRGAGQGGGKRARREGLRTRDPW